MSAQVFDPRPCTLGEGPLWHPERQQLFWFDITGNRLFTRSANGPQEWDFGENVSAAGWVDADTLLIASETALFRFDLATDQRQNLCACEADTPTTRSNDGRADPWGGFWIGTMGKAAEPGAGAIYRYFGGTLTRLFSAITIPNAICFSPDRRFALFADTATGTVQQVALDAQGWPSGTPRVFVDLRREKLNPDGAVIDAAGTLWLAQWGAARVAAYDPNGAFVRAISFPAPHTSCPVFGGADGQTLFCTTALQGMSAKARAAYPQAGQTFAVPGVALGQAEHRVIL